MKKEKFDLNNLEIIQDSDKGMLIGGFSPTSVLPIFTGLMDKNNCPVINNCQGTNCVKNCGTTSL